MAPRSNSINLDEERDLACRLAGLLFLIGGATSLALLVLPGGDAAHWPAVVVIAASCAAWGLYCLTVRRPELKGAYFWHVPAAISLGVIAAVMAATGGAGSPARFYPLFVLLYTAYFFPRRQALPYLAGCIVVSLLPFAYERGLVEAGYAAELMVLCPAYVVLALLIGSGKELLVRLREQARTLSLADPLTELPNRRALLEWLDRELERGTPIGLMIVDLDRFKDVNTRHGYPAGDAVLRETARTLRGCVRADDLVARLGGDEFAVCAPCGTPATMRMLSERVLSALRVLDHEGVHLTASVGWVLDPEGAGTVDELIGSADLCMRRAKSTGKDRALSALDRAPEGKLSA